MNEDKKIMKASMVCNLESCEKYIRKINRRIEWCNNEVLAFYQLNGANDELGQRFLSEIRLRLKDLEE